MQIRLGRRLRLNISLDFKFWDRKLNREITKIKADKGMIEVVKHIRDISGMTIRESLEYAKRVFKMD